MSVINLIPSHGLRIGLLGGSFNPAHDGHSAISLIALRQLALDEIWWLVSPQNPLKPTTDMAPFATRLNSARQKATHRAIKVSDLESQFGTRYSYDTIRLLKERGRGIKFVWLMGADNFVQLPKWKNWADIMTSLPVAVIARPDHHIKAGLCPAAQRFAKYRLPQEDANLLADLPAPAWTLLYGPLHSQSSTALRGVNFKN